VTSPPLRGERAWCSGRSDPRALAILHEWLKATGTEMNEARLRMTRIPKGADLILVSGGDGPNTCGVRAHDAQKLARTKRAVEDMLQRVRRASE
jgi:hypothetical protein